MILSLNNGRAMSDRLMYEYSRAAMSLEQRKGREFIIQMTNHIYSSKNMNSCNLQMASNNQTKIYY